MNHYFFGFCVVYTKTIIHLSVGECGGYLPRCFVASWLGKYPLLLNMNCQWSLKVCAFLLIGRCNYFSSVLRHSYYTPKTKCSDHQFFCSMTHSSWFRCDKLRTPFLLINYHTAQPQCHARHAR